MQTPRVSSCATRADSFHIRRSLDLAVVHLAHSGVWVRIATCGLLIVLSFSMASLVCKAQCSSDTTPCIQSVPRLIKFGGVVKNPLTVSHAGVVSLRFVVYDDSKGGTALWQEVQNTQTDAEGRYEVFLGAASSDGIPESLFVSGEPRWL